MFPERNPLPSVEHNHEITRVGLHPLLSLSLPWFPFWSLGRIFQPVFKHLHYHPLTAVLRWGLSIAIWKLWALSWIFNLFITWSTVACDRFLDSISSDIPLHRYYPESYLSWALSTHSDLSICLLRFVLRIMPSSPTWKVLDKTWVCALRIFCAILLIWMIFLPDFSSISCNPMWSLLTLVTAIAFHCSLAASWYICVQVLVLSSNM